MQKLKILMAIAILMLSSGTVFSQWIVIEGPEARERLFPQDLIPNLSTPPDPNGGVWNGGQYISFIVSENPLCSLSVEWRWRYNVDGEKEILISRMRIVGDEDCKERCHKMKQQLIDRVMRFIIFEKKVFGRQEIPQCPNVLSFYRLYVSSCSQNLWFPPNTHFEIPCTENGWCKYKYTYCFELDNNSVLQLKETINKEMFPNIDPCPINEYPLHSSKCYPIDCTFRRIINFPVPDIYIPVYIPDELFYKNSDN